MTSPSTSQSYISRLDLKPENVLICIDDVESIIQAELASSNTASSPTTKLVGVPPSKGRGGNQTPRSESVFITGSQPLPSPSSSFGSSPMLDKWAFGMSKIDREEASPEKSGLSTLKRPESADLAAEVGNVSLNTRAGSFVGRVPGAPGPSLLSQQAPMVTSSSTRPLPVPGKAQVMEDDSLDDAAETNERITVKIADLGNGETSALWSSSSADVSLQLPGSSTTSRTIFRRGNIAAPKSSSALNGELALTSGA